MSELFSILSISEREHQRTLLQEMIALSFPLELLLQPRKFTFLVCSPRQWRYCRMFTTPLRKKVIDNIGIVMCSVTDRFRPKIHISGPCSNLATICLCIDAKTQNHGNTSSSGKQTSRFPWPNSFSRRQTPKCFLQLSQMVIK